MSKCQHVRECAFYNNQLKEIPNDGIFFKDMFCRRGAEKCARNKQSDIADVGDTENMIHPLGMKISELYDS